MSYQHQQLGYQASPQFGRIYRQDDSIPEAFTINVSRGIPEIYRQPVEFLTNSINPYQLDHVYPSDRNPSILFPIPTHTSFSIFVISIYTDPYSFNSHNPSFQTNSHSQSNMSVMGLETQSIMQVSVKNLTKLIELRSASPAIQYLDRIILINKSQLESRETADILNILKMHYGSLFDTGHNKSHLTNRVNKSTIILEVTPSILSIGVSKDGIIAINPAS